MVDLSRFESLPAKCCRGVYWHDTVEKVREMSTPGGPLEYDIENESEGFPCVHLREGLCALHETGKPGECEKFPGLSVFPTCVEEFCSYSFDELGRRTGSCDGCKGAINA